VQIVNYPLRIRDRRRLVAARKQLARARRQLLLEEIARGLRRDQIEVRDKVAEVGRACR
jgi:hypothetical protein